MEALSVHLMSFPIEGTNLLSLGRLLFFLFQPRLGKFFDVDVLSRLIFGALGCLSLIQLLEVLRQCLLELLKLLEALWVSALVRMKLQRPPLQCLFYCRLGLCPGSPHGHAAAEAQEGKRRPLFQTLEPTFGLCVPLLESVYLLSKLIIRRAFKSVIKFSLVPQNFLGKPGGGQLQSLESLLASGNGILLSKHLFYQRQHQGINSKERNGLGNLWTPLAYQLVH
mmetsp:Transcript_65370/g.119247  ORF Transcript_65370/g.119247 Transcript_65370/m.119247 type:complete len:224 (+) Transcript_65370:285-956(+)